MMDLSNSFFKINKKMNMIFTYTNNKKSIIISRYGRNIVYYSKRFK